MHLLEKRLTKLDPEKQKESLEKHYQQMVNEDLLKVSANNIRALAEVLQQHELQPLADALWSHLRMRRQLLMVIEMVNIFQGPAADRTILHLGGEYLNREKGGIEFLPTKSYLVPRGRYEIGKPLDILPQTAMTLSEFFEKFADSKAA